MVTPETRAAQSHGLTHERFVVGVHTDDDGPGRQVGQDRLGHLEGTVGAGAQFAGDDSLGQFESRSHEVLGEGDVAGAPASQVLLGGAGQLADQGAGPGLGGGPDRFVGGEVGRIFRLCLAGALGIAGHIALLKAMVVAFLGRCQLLEHGAHFHEAGDAGGKAVGRDDDALIR